MVTMKNRAGFLFSMIGCACGLSVAILSGQYGFMAYNAILIFMMARGYTGWRKREAIVALGAE